MVSEAEQTGTDGLEWYVLTVFKREIEAKSDLEEESQRRQAVGRSPLQSFVPLCHDVVTVAGRKVRRCRPLIQGYVFVRSTLRDIYEYKQAHPYLHFRRPLGSDGGKRYLTVPQQQMDDFMRVAALYEQDIRFYRPEEVDLQKGDRVRIIGGDFNGVEGLLLRSQGRGGGRVVVSIPDVVAVSTWVIRPEYIEVLEFAPTGRRLYNHLDAFSLKAREAMRLHWRHKPLPVSLRASLQSFVTRLRHLCTGTINLQSTLNILLLMGYTALDSKPQREAALRHTMELLPQIVTDTQRAFCLTHLYACTADPHFASEAHAIIDTWPPMKQNEKKRREIIADLAEYEERGDAFCR